jgi:hypothetical protein
MQVWAANPIPEEVVMRSLSGLVAILFVLTLTVVGFAGSDIPDLKGTWTMKCKGIGHIKPSKSPDTKLHTEKLGTHDLELLLVIDQQDGFRFSGYQKSSKMKELVAGVIGFDNQTVYIVDGDGISIAKLVSPDTMESIYLHVTEAHSIAARAIITRKR